MKALLLILGIILIEPAFSNSCEPSENSCGYYLCLESEKNCGSKGYLVNFGNRFCKYFKNTEVEDPSLSNWIKDTRYCLQEKIKDKKNLNCIEIKEQSVDDHVDCYLRYGYCELSLKNKRSIRNLIIKNIWVDPAYFFKNAKAMLKHDC